MLLLDRMNQCLPDLPHGSSGIPAFIPAKLVLDLAILGGCKAELT